jgi:preprotein translocase subunit SecE
MKFFSDIVTFLREVRVELKKVNWPSRKEAVQYTAFVIGFSAVVAALLGSLDFLYITILRVTVLR